MKVLGLSPLDKDSTVTLVEDGRILYAAGEERFTRVKLQDGFPWRALEDALAATGTQIGEIDRVVYPFLTYDEETRLFQKNLANEREFLDEADVNDTSDELRDARARVPSGRPTVPGLATPDERLDKGLLKTVAYRVLASEGVVSPSEIGIPLPVTFITGAHGPPRRTIPRSLSELVTLSPSTRILPSRWMVTS